DFYHVVQHTVFPNNSHGKLGGKSAGIFLARNILRDLKENTEWGDYIRTPKAWYITSDTMHYFLYYNNLKEVIEQKYKSIEQIREEYPNIIQVFKNSYFPPEIIKGFSLALDDLGGNPIIVRSSSLLEDRVGAAFSGKYKSLFLANQGTKEERINALMDAVAEVYASTFSPDPIEYRTERGLLDFHEEMAIIIQEVVGKRVGRYYLPAFAGVAFSNNEFRWSSRIKREDGLMRIVPGLGTRAVDRLSDDYPILVAPGQPTLRVNITSDEVFRYSPKKADVINLESNTFETVEINSFLKEFGHEYPEIEKIISFFEGNRFVNRNKFNLDFEKDDFVVTFEGLLSKTPFLERMKCILDTLKEKIGIPVDIEFASDGEYFYVLQCRAQSYATGTVPSIIPKDVADNKIIFTAKKFISNGIIPDISHVVYVSPEKYSEVESIEDLKNIGKTVGILNKILPKRKFILMGPGRWGSRGDIKLGVDVTYSEINNTAALIEIARKKGNYTPDLSFGTHFFQDLVEAAIRYIPLYPDDPNIMFNEEFLENSPNVLSELVPQFKHLDYVIRVIDINKTTDSQVLRILMNADTDEAIAFLSSYKPVELKEQEIEITTSTVAESHWRWRLRMAEHIAENLDGAKYGVKGMYVFGSAKNAVSGPASDIDLLIHFGGTEDQKNKLMEWLDGWSLCLSELNYLKTGVKTRGLLDIHIITDTDIENKDSFAIKINAVTDPARALNLRSTMR
ncbi:MAG: PEP/pyruvate-binding domain-containing protein, partial [Candidatus Cloacimonetes bacterium]|nr:PEP/pyruvate-binding domain-containing protein [Candidatus Cloacimonadota bacterium]